MSKEGIQKDRSQLKSAIAGRDWELSRKLCFHLLYGKAYRLQTDLACTMMQEYLPIFAKHWPAVAWPAQLLTSPERWHDKHGRSLPDEPMEVNPADAAFLICFDAVLLAIAYPTNHLTVTSSCLVAVDNAINARATNVWMADDPQAVELWAAQGYIPRERTVTENVASIAVYERGWRQVQDWLAQKVDWGAKVDVHPEEIGSAYDHWRQHEMGLIVPLQSGPKRASCR